MIGPRQFSDESLTQVRTLMGFCLVSDGDNVLLCPVFFCLSPDEDELVRLTSQLLLSGHQ